MNTTQAIVSDIELLESLTKEFKGLHIYQRSYGDKRFWGNIEFNKDNTLTTISFKDCDSLSEIFAQITVEVNRCKSIPAL